MFRLLNSGVLAALAACFLLAAPGLSAEPRQEAVGLNDLSLEVAALQTIYA